MKANTSGQVAEHLIALMLRGLGCEFERQVPIGESIYSRPGRKHTLRADFVITNLVDFPSGLAVESKWQDAPGSVDEKFPYLAENILTRYRLPAIVIVHGGACRFGALDYLQDRCDGKRLIAVLGLDIFISWILRAEKHRALDLFPEDLFA